MSFFFHDILFIAVYQVLSPSLVLFVMRTKEIGTMRAQTIVKRRLNVTPSNYVFGNIMIEQSLSFNAFYMIVLYRASMVRIVKCLKELKIPKPF